MLCSLPPDVLHVIVRLSCSDMHSKVADAAAAAQDTATALRLSCRTLKAAVDATVAELTCLDIRASSSADIAQAAALFSGLQRALGPPSLIVRCGVIWHRHALCILPPAGLQRIQLRVPAGATTIRVRHEQLPCLTDIRCDNIYSAHAHLHIEVFLSAPIQTTTVKLVHAG
jgi:hypothetical protein